VLSLHVVPRAMTAKDDAFRPAGELCIETFCWLGRQVLVTGGTGFIGRYLVDTLVAAGARIIVLARPHGVTLKDSRQPSDQVVHRHGDLSEPSSLSGVCDGVDTVFHLAGYAHAEDSTSAKANQIHWQTTVEGTRAILHEAKSAGVKRFVFVSTVKAQGEGNSQCEDESSPTHPVSGYGHAKLAAEELVLDIDETQSMNTAVVRLPLVYGGGNKGNIPRMIAAIDRGRFPPLLTAHNQRSMVHVADVIHALLLVADRPQFDKQLYIVTDGRLYSTSDIYKAICHALGKPIPSWSTPIWLLRLGAKIGDLIGFMIGRPISLNSATLQKLFGSACYNSDKIERELGFTPHHTLYNALPDMVAEYRASKALN
jgi:UDP-glucose 4-epimerase